MDSTNDFTERRKHKRFKLKDTAFAIIDYNPTKMGQITDISRSGLAIHYANNGQGSNRPDELDIFKPDLSCYIEKIKVKTVSDLEVIGSASFKPKKMRRCGMQFGVLTSSQIFHLESLLQNYAVI